MANASLVPKHVIGPPGLESGQLRIDAHERRAGDVAGR